MSNALPNLKGRVAFIFEESDFDVDQIIGVKNIKIQDVDELAALAMQSYDPDFQKNVRPGDVIVGADNFGYGHPHYPPMRAMRHLGIAGVIAESFSPGYWRGEISMGFPQASCPGILGFVRALGRHRGRLGRQRRPQPHPQQASSPPSSRCPSPTARCSRPAGSFPISSNRKSPDSILGGSSHVASQFRIPQSRPCQQDRLGRRRL